MAAPQIVASSPASGGITGATSQSVAVPVGTGAGDIILAVVSHLGTGAPSGPPSGFTLKASQTGTGDDLKTGWGGLYWKRASGSETTIGVTGGTGSTSMVLLTVTGCVGTGDPFDAVSSRLNSATGGSGSDSITTTVGDTRVIAAAAIFDNRSVSSWAVTDPGALTTHVGVLNTTGDDSGAAMASAAKTAAGATGTLTWSMTFSTNVGFLFALAPAESGSASAQAATAAGVAANATVSVFEPDSVGVKYVDSSGAQDTNVLTLDVTIPGTAGEGDLALLAVTVAPGVTTGDPAGWELLDGFPTAPTTGQGRMYVWQRTIVPGDEGTDVTVTVDSSSRITGSVLVMEPALLDGDPVITTQTSSGTVADVGSVDPTSRRSALVVFAGSNSAQLAEQPAWTPPNGMQARQSLTTTGGTRNATLGVFTKTLNSADPTGPLQATSSLAVNRQTAAIALRTSAQETNALAEAAEAVGEALFDPSGYSESLELQAINPISATVGDNPPTPAVDVQEDEFNDGSIAPRWTIVDPAGDCTVTATGTTLQMEAPVTEHNQRGNQNNRDALKVLQPVAGDFDVVLKFDDIPTQLWDGWGFYCDGGTGTGWLRADVTRNGSDGVLHAVCNTSDVEAGPTISRVDSVLPNLEFVGSFYIRLSKVGTTFTYYTSPNRQVWIQRALFDWPGRVSRIGPMLVKVASALPAVVDVDWFRETGNVGANTDVQALPAEGVGTAYEPASINTLTTASAVAWPPNPAVFVNPETAEATGVASATAGVGPAAETTATAVAHNAIADRSDRGDLYIDALGDASALQPSMSVGVHALTA